jgi:hypothetical protein
MFIAHSHRLRNHALTSNKHQTKDELKLVAHPVGVAKSKTMLVLKLHAFILSGKIDFATGIRSGHEPAGENHIIILWMSCFNVVAKGSSDQNNCTGATSRMLGFTLNY